MRKNLKIIKLNGGLGNQLFQYSLGLCLSQNKNYNIVYDKSYYQKRVDAPVIQIEKVFKIKLKNLNNEAIDFKTKIFTNRFFIFILNKINPKILENKGVFIEKNKIFDFRILKPHKYFFFLGYFQSEDYFLKIKKKLKKK